jgi:hypothetical protein
MSEKNNDDTHVDDLRRLVGDKSPTTAGEVYIPDYVMHDFGQWQHFAELTSSAGRPSADKLGKR